MNDLWAPYSGLKVAGGGLSRLLLLGRVGEDRNLLSISLSMLCVRNAASCNALCAACHFRPSYLHSCCCFEVLFLFWGEHSLLSYYQPFTWLPLTHFSGPRSSLQGHVFKEAFFDPPGVAKAPFLSPLAPLIASGKGRGTRV